MPGMTRLALACALVSTAACAAEPTRPASPLRVPSGAQRSMDPHANDDGTCRSGYILANGRCAPI
jgi:hypothetical protein